MIERDRERERKRKRERENEGERERDRGTRKIKLLSHEKDILHRHSSSSSSWVQDS